MNRTNILILAAFVCLVVGGIACAQSSKDDINIHKTCSHCGMDRGVFDFSRMLIEYEDGTQAGVCSLHCAAIDLANNIDKTPKSIKVGEFGGKQLIDAQKAFWVVGGDKPGVMSKTGKWAFEKKEDAENFIKAHQGRLASFDGAMNTAYDDMAEDTKMIREKRKMNRMKMAEEKPRDEH